MECNNDILLDESIEQLLEMKERNLYLNKHPNKIWQGKDGKWRTYVGSGKERKLVKRSSRPELNNYICEFYKEQEFNPSISDLYDLWINYKLDVGEIKPPTKDRYDTDYDRFIKGSALEITRVKCVTADDLDIFIRQAIAKHNLTQKAYSNLRTLILGMFKYAKRHHMTDLSISEFFKDLDISKRCFYHKPIDMDTAIFKDEEVMKLIRYCYAHPTIENLGLIFAFQSGVRRGELVAIKFDDITDNVLHVQRQEIIYKSKIKGQLIHAIVDYTKTEAGNRYIYLPESSFNVLMMMRWVNKDCDYILAKDGERIQKTSIDHIILKACDGAGIPRRSMHKIRRTYGTTLIDNNVEDSLIMSQMGHSCIDTTRKYYYFANKDNEHKKEQINKSIRW